MPEKAEGAPPQFDHMAILSDCHITDSDDELYRALLRLIDELGKKPRAVLVLAGDIFDVWVGGKQVYLDRYPEFVDALARARAAGLQVYYVQGNHDFLMDMALSLTENITVVDQEVSFGLGNKKVYVAHGDLIDQADYRYRALRFIFRSPFNRGLVRILPSSVVDRIGQSSSRYGKDAARQKRGEIPLNRVKRTRSLFRNFAAQKVAEGFDIVVLGHCHDRDEMTFKVGDREGVYFNVGYPRVHGSFVAASANAPALERKPLSSL